MTGCAYASVFGRFLENQWKQGTEALAGILRITTKRKYLFITEYYMVSAKLLFRDAHFVDRNSGKAVKDWAAATVEGKGALAQAHTGLLGKQ